MHHIEYAVKMRRLPREAMMDVLLAKDQVSAEMVTGVAQILADFHRRAESSTAISAFGDLETIIQNTGENFSQTEKYIGRTITGNQYRCIKDYTSTFIDNNTSLFQGRRLRLYCNWPPPWQDRKDPAGLNQLS